MKFFITTAIDYVNSLPHLGTAYEKIGADVLARFHRMAGDQVLFQMGNDEHSVNVKKSAEARGLAPKPYCDEMRPKFEDIWKKLFISYDEFIQTSNLRHHAAVQKMFKKIHGNGDIYEGEYEGLYCESCEAFYTEKDLVDGLCPQHKSKPKYIKEKNFFFKLSAYADALMAHIEKNPQFILPAVRKNEIINVIKGGLKDVSISRAGFDWGIPVIQKPGHVVYVWFDALINYITCIGYADDDTRFAHYWPADYHIIGKDITRFHCVIWAAMLMAAGLKLPRSIFGHGFVYLQGERMSKSLGNVVNPLDVVDQYGADSLRYYLMRTSSFGDDADFTWDDFILRYNSDLANGLGNMVSRTSGMITKYFSGHLSPAPLDGDDLRLANQYEERLAQIQKLLDPLQSGDVLFHRALENIWSWMSEVDRYIDVQTPWALAKQKNEARLNEVLTTVVRAIFGIGILATPFIPDTVSKIWKIFSWESCLPWAQLNFSHSWKDIPVSVQPRSSLFPRIEKNININE